MTLIFTVLVCVTLLAGFGIALGFGMFIFVSVLAVFALLVVTKLDSWAPVVILLYPIRDVALTTVGLANVRIGDVALLVALALWAVQGAMRMPRWRFPAVTLTMILGVLVFYNALTMIWAPSGAYGLARSLKLLRGLGFFLLVASALIVDWERNYRWMMIALWLTGAALVTTYAVTFMQGGGLATLTGLQQLEVIDSNNLEFTTLRSFSGGYLISTAPPWLILCVFLVTGGMPQLRLSRPLQSILVSGLVLMVIAIALSGYRGPLLGLVGGLAVVMALSATARSQQARRWAGAIIALLVIVSLAIWFSGIGHIVLTRFAALQGLDVDTATQTRLLLWEQMLRLWAQQPLTGVGTGVFLALTRASVHNMFLQVLGELGLIGFTLLCIAIAVTVRYLWQVSRHALAQKDTHNFWLSNLVLGCLVAYLISALTMDNLEEFNFWLIAALTVAMWVRAKTSHSTLAGKLDNASTTSPLLIRPGNQASSTNTGYR
jgi:O-antigen ligase